MNVTNRTSELDPDFRRSMKTKIQGTRTRHVITFNPNKANPGEVIYIDTPKLKPDVCLVPGSLNLMFDFKNANVKSWFHNNLSKLLTKELTLKMAGEVVLATQENPLWKSTRICGRHRRKEIILSSMELEVRI